MTLLRIAKTALVAAAVGTSAFANAGAHASELTGSPEGIALAKRVNAAYAHVAGLVERSDTTIEGDIPVTMTWLMGLRDGNIVAVRWTVAGPGATKNEIHLPTVTYRRMSNERCWTKLGFIASGDFGGVLGKGRFSIRRAPASLPKLEMTLAAAASPTRSTLGPTVFCGRSSHRFREPISARCRTRRFG